ncbi:MULTISPECIES: CBS domain-containing protein [Bradyrhizobium]|uniref:CBS domain-containing protein n=1 Tax=Bradyrhizobium elkanii TaxID=29448 RepID=A0A4U6S2F1_BRAEL|nr:MULTISPECIES: CBS domain-containing protein [Bradyrhizobium]MTV15468.1 CBS domain-containing protein [Bradyrhizobium sp. BR2003]TKV81191.1 CBS domain-containing protein [Bradyrhizobium elkanii]
MQARDVMVSPVITVTKSATVRDVARTMLEKRISAVPVVDDADKVIGIVTESDMLHRVEAGTERRDPWWVRFLAGETAIAAEYAKSHARHVADVMTTEVISATPETPLHEVATLLEERAIKRVPIVNKAGELVGIVSRANLIQAVASARPKLAMHLPDSTIRQRLLDDLKKQSWAHPHSLNAVVTNGTVDLWGFVDSDKERKAIRVAAENIPGVVSVNDHLMIKPVLVY